MLCCFRHCCQNYSVCNVQCALICDGGEGENLKSHKTLLFACFLCYIYDSYAIYGFQMRCSSWYGSTEASVAIR